MSVSLSSYRRPDSVATPAGRQIMSSTVPFSLLFDDETGDATSEGTKRAPDLSRLAQLSDSERRLNHLSRGGGSRQGSESAAPLRSQMLHRQVQGIAKFTRPYLLDGSIRVQRVNPHFLNKAYITEENLVDADGDIIYKHPAKMSARDNDYLTYFKETDLDSTSRTKIKVRLTERPSTSINITIINQQKENQQKQKLSISNDPVLSSSESTDAFALIPGQMSSPQARVLDKKEILRIKRNAKEVGYVKGFLSSTELYANYLRPRPTVSTTPGTLFRNGSKSVQAQQQVHKLKHLKMKEGAERKGTAKGRSGGGQDDDVNTGSSVSNISQAAQSDPQVQHKDHLVPRADCVLCKQKGADVKDGVLAMSINKGKTDVSALLPTAARHGVHSSQFSMESLWNNLGLNEHQPPVSVREKEKDGHGRARTSHGTKRGQPLTDTAVQDDDFALFDQIHRRYDAHLYANKILGSSASPRGSSSSSSTLSLLDKHSPPSAGPNGIFVDAFPMDTPARFGMTGQTLGRFNAPGGVSGSLAVLNSPHQKLIHTHGGGSNRASPSKGRGGPSSQGRRDTDGAGTEGIAENAEDATAAGGAERSVGDLASEGGAGGVGGVGDDEEKAGEAWGEEEVQTRRTNKDAVGEKPESNDKKSRPSTRGGSVSRPPSKLAVMVPNGKTKDDTDRDGAAIVTPRTSGRGSFSVERTSNEHAKMAAVHEQHTTRTPGWSTGPTVGTDPSASASSSSSSSSSVALAHLHVPPNVDFEGLLRAYDLLCLEATVLRRKVHGRTEEEYTKLAEQNRKLKEIVLALHEKQQKWEKLDNRVLLNQQLEVSQEHVKEQKQELAAMEAAYKLNCEFERTYPALQAEVERLKAEVQSKKLANAALMEDLFSLEETHKECGTRIEELAHMCRNLQAYKDRTSVAKAKRNNA